MIDLNDIYWVADFTGEGLAERVGVITFGVGSWFVAAVTQSPPATLMQSVIQILPPLLGIYVAHLSMKRADALRMEKERSKREAKDADQNRP